MKKLLRQWKNHRAFSALPRQQRRIVFYSEGPNYTVHLWPIIESLRGDHGQPLVYLSSSEDDPWLDHPDAGVKCFYIGAGSVRTLLFAGLDTDVLVMTMPDLHNYYIKRSPHAVHYVYVHHSIVSCHMVYRPDAFDHFDSIFCVGPHHEKEIRARERQANLPAKSLVRHGYGRLDALAESRERHRSREPGRASDRLNVLIAPSWGEDALLERCGCDFIAPLLECGFRVTLRPHPQTRRFHGRVLDDAASRYGSSPHFTLEENVASEDSLLGADIMVSDWSGAALEFAFAAERPVLFVDVPRKTLNPDWQSLDIEPLEGWIRSEIGSILPEDQLDSMASALQSLADARDSYAGRIRELKSACIFNPGQSGPAGARAILDCLEPDSEAS